MSQKTGNSSSSSAKASGSGAPTPPRNQFLKSGNQGVFEMTETKKACVMRVDMPGRPESDLIYWVDGDNIHFFADEPAMAEYQNSGRKYGGTMVINPGTYDVKNAKAKLVNGVMWITIPKISGTLNVKIGVTEMMVRCNITREDLV